jgi:gliding motility-associated-like protein
MPYARNQFLKNGNYKVLLGYTSIEGCYQNIEKSIEITSNFDILAPNSFTPNGDGRNDEFMPEGLKTKGQPFEMKIFDRTGEIIFITKNANNGWNGFNQTTGSKSGSDNYLWVVEIKEENGKVSLFKGSLLLIDN